MSLFSKFTYLMKHESQKKKIKQKRAVWIIDESKCLKQTEVKKLREVGKKVRMQGIREHNYSKIRRWFMIELGLNTGLRVSEMCSIKVGNLLFENGRSSLFVVGKGNKKRSIWISTEFKKTCLVYLSLKAEFGIKSNQDSFLLNNRQGKQITKRALQKDFKLMLRLAEIALYYSFHCLRHTYATFLLMASNHDYRFVQKQLGHASINTTQIYAGVLESEGRKAIEKLYR